MDGRPVCVDEVEERSSRRAAWQLTDRAQLQRCTRERVVASEARRWRSSERATDRLQAVW